MNRGEFHRNDTGAKSRREGWLTSWKFWVGIATGFLIAFALPIVVAWFTT